MDMRGVDLNLLVVFDALMSERSVTRAAARLGRTQPAMSAALARLRALLGDDLFIRAPRGLEPTPRASELGAPISEALRGLSVALDRPQRFAAAAATHAFTLALSDHPAFVLLPPLAAKLAALAPGVDLQIRGFTDRQHAEDLLERGVAHAAVGVPAAWGKNITTAPLFEDHFVSVVRPRHPLTRQRVTLKRFLAYPHVLVSPEGDRRGRVDAKLAEQGLRRRVAISLPQMYAAPRLVAATDLVATLMAGVVAAPLAAGELTALKLPLELPPISFVLAWHRRNEAHPAQRWLRETISAVAQALSEPPAAKAARRSRANPKR